MSNKPEIVKALRLVWDSMESHLDDSVGPTSEKECCRKAVGTPSFHVKCCKEYGFIIKVLSDCL